MIVMMNASRASLFPAALLGLSAAGCFEVPTGSTEKNDLANLPQVTVAVPGKASYTAWVADSERERQLGLMNVTDAELPADRGMIFVFAQDDYLSFWMRNTIIPLDIAYIRSDGTIVKIYTMQPLDESGKSSIEPARFALEVRAGQFAAHGITEGDTVELPDELFD